MQLIPVLTDNCLLRQTISMMTTKKGKATTLLGKIPLIPVLQVLCKVQLTALLCKVQLNALLSKIQLKTLLCKVREMTLLCNILLMTLHVKCTG
jgi:hypothetical protein